MEAKREVEDDTLEEEEEEHGPPLNKRFKQASLIEQQQGMGMGDLSMPPAELVPMRPSQANSPKHSTQTKKDQKGTAPSGTSEILIASHFPASILRIGTWEYKSRNRGDLVAKCYFSNMKLIWEVLDGSLKNKIEIRWSDIVALKANYPDDRTGTLDVVLARPPDFFRENPPEPRRNISWKKTSDFTGGEASIYKCHFLECKQRLLRKNFEKLVQCDPRFSQQGDITVDNPYFDPRIRVFDDPNDNKAGFDLPSSGQSSSSSFFSRPRESTSLETPSPSPVNEEIKSQGEQLKELSNWDQIRVPEQKTSDNEDRQELEILDYINCCLFSDPQNVPAASDEKPLKDIYTSFSCLLEKDPPAGPPDSSDKSTDGCLVVASDSKQQTPSMSRKDSFEELLLNLESLSQFSFNTSEDLDSQARW